MLAEGEIDVLRVWEYSFQLPLEDGGRLRIGGEDVIVDSGYHPPSLFRGNLFLIEGLPSLDLLYYDTKGPACVELGVTFGQPGFTRRFRNSAKQAPRNSSVMPLSPSCGLRKCFNAEPRAGGAKSSRCRGRVGPPTAAGTRSSRGFLSDLTH